MKIPESAADEIKEIDSEEIIINPFHGKKQLSRKEALDCINHLSGALLADECYKR